LISCDETEKYGDRKRKENETRQHLKCQPTQCIPEKSSANENIQSLSSSDADIRRRQQKLM
jgi:hypothetical protein